MSLPSISVLMLLLFVLVCMIRLLRSTMCLNSYSWQTSLQRPRLEQNIVSFSPNLVLWIHHEFEGGGVLEKYLYSSSPTS
jgi:hypothetical protein